MGAPLALLAAVVALHAPRPATHDMLYTFLGDRGPVYEDSFSPSPLSSKDRRRPAVSGSRLLLLKRPRFAGAQVDDVAVA
jgi:hypothetical protein